MIFRIVANTKAKDLLRVEIDKYFQKYIIFSVDTYINNVKGIAYIIEVEGYGSECASNVHKVAIGIAKVIGAKVQMQKIETPVLTVAHSDKAEEPQPQTPQQPKPVAQTPIQTPSKVTAKQPAPSKE